MNMKLNSTPIKEDIKVKIIRRKKKKKMVFLLYINLMNCAFTLFLFYYLMMGF